jgi:hypothetical protein
VRASLLGDNARFLSDPARIDPVRRLDRHVGNLQQHATMRRVIRWRSSCAQRSTRGASRPSQHYVRSACLYAQFSCLQQLRLISNTAIAARNNKVRTGNADVDHHPNRKGQKQLPDEVG